MDTQKKVSITLLAIGFLLMVYGIYRMNTAPDLTEAVGREDQSGMYILSVGAVLAIFVTGSLVGKKSD